MFSESLYTKRCIFFIQRHRAVHILYVELPWMMGRRLIKPVKRNRRRMDFFFIKKDKPLAAGQKGCCGASIVMEIGLAGCVWWRYRRQFSRQQPKQTITNNKKKTFLIYLFNRRSKEKGKGRELWWIVVSFLEISSRQQQKNGPPVTTRTPQRRAAVVFRQLTLWNFFFFFFLTFRPSARGAQLKWIITQKEKK